MTAQGLSLKNVFARALEVFGATRIVFGTDSTTFPKGWQRARFDDQQRALVEIGLSEEDLNAIFCENARELLVRVV